MPDSERYPYGAGHRKARTKALGQLQEGEPCPFCSRPMYLDQDLDFDHMVPLVEGGAQGPRRLAHASCNRSAGAKLGNRRRGQGKRAVAAPVPPVAPSADPPAPGSPCYRCGQPLLAGESLRSGAAAYGNAAVWWHARCIVWGVSVPPDLL